MAKAVWNGQTLAESDTYETVEGNIYFPDESGVLSGEFDDLELHLEGPGAVLHPGGGWPGESGCGVVLP
jgi:hypothetical protein